MKRVFLTLCLCFSAVIFAVEAFAGEYEVSAESFEFSEEVEVGMPSFDVVLNGRKYDSVGAEYPCIVYKDVTYLPMADAVRGYMGLQMHRGYVMSRSYQDINFVFVGNAGIVSDELVQVRRDGDALPMKALVYRDTPKTKGAYKNKDGYLVLYYTVVQGG